MSWLEVLPKHESSKLTVIQALYRAIPNLNKSQLYREQKG